MPMLSDAPFIAGEARVPPVKPEAKKPVSAGLQAYRDFVKANCNKMPGKTPQERLKQCAAKYRESKTSKADKE